MTAESISPRRDFVAGSNLSLDILRLLCEERWLSDKDIRARVAPTTLAILSVHLSALCDADLIGSVERFDGSVAYVVTEAGRQRIREIDERLVGQDGGPRVIAWLFVSIIGFVIAVLTYSSC